MEQFELVDDEQMNEDYPLTFNLLFRLGRDMG